MTKIVAFAGVPNTGKTTLIQGVPNKIVGLQKHLEFQGCKVKVLKEFARMFFFMLPHNNKNYSDMTAFQKMVHASEIARLGELQSLGNYYDFILIDRTFYENQLFAEFNMDKGLCEQFEFFEDPCSKDIYDQVILLTEPIKDNTTEGLKHYNDREFVDDFNQQVRWYYKNKVTDYSNAKEDRIAIFEQVISL